MVDTIYVEAEIAELDRTREIISRYPKANRIYIERYGEVFNSHAQNFRIQKRNPALILAAKKNKKVMPAPEQYETGGGAQYYFSHMLNCVYDCRYCFLQGMFRSANYLLFVNYEEFVQEISEVADSHNNDKKPVWFYSGYDCDSLAYEPVTGFANHFIDAFAAIPNSVLELRTKSTQIRSLLNKSARDNVVVAYSLSPTRAAREVEIGAPSFDKRLDALLKLQQQGWRIGLRFDPIIWHKGYLADYEGAINKVFNVLDPDQIDSVTLGGFRLPKGFYKTMHKLYPEHWLLNAGLTEHSGMINYRRDIETEALDKVAELCAAHIQRERLFTYPSYKQAE